LKIKTTNAMKTCIFIIALTVFGFGCATQNLQTLPFDPNHSEKVVSQRLFAEPIPFPTKTPFDSDAKEREAYLNGFHKAWDYVASGFFLHGTLGVSKPAGLEEAWDCGWKDGCKDAGDRWMLESEKLREGKTSQSNSAP
jgi:hypothetical protein